MKRTLIIPATIALLTGMAATAQEPNATDMDVNASASMEKTSDTQNIDELSIEELNALQLKVLEDPKASDATAETDTIIMAEADTSMNAETDQSADVTVDGSDADMNDTTTAEADITAETEMGVGGPDYASETDAMADLAMQGTIADLAAEDPRFTTFVAMVEQAGLTDKLDGDAEYTVFAPTNAAFEKLDPLLVTKLKSGDANDKLTSILKAHIVEGETLSSNIADGEISVTTLADADVSVNKSGDSVTIGNATVVAADIDASNGVIHAVDTVIMPDEES